MEDVEEAGKEERGVLRERGKRLIGLRWEKMEECLIPVIVERIEKVRC